MVSTQVALRRERGGRPALARDASTKVLKAARPQGMARGTTVSCKLAGNADGLDRLAEYFGGVGALLVSSTLSVAQHGQTRQHWQRQSGPPTRTTHALLEAPSARMCFAVV